MAFANTGPQGPVASEGEMYMKKHATLFILSGALAVPSAALGAQPTCFPPGKANSPACDAKGQQGEPTRTDDGPGPFDKPTR